MRMWGPSSFCGHRLVVALPEARARRDDRAVRADSATVTIDRADAVSLVGVLALVAGHAAAGDVTPKAMEHLQRRLAADLDVHASASLDELLTMLNHRLRRAIGEPE
jgi:hypothetical protein